MNRFALKKTGVAQMHIWDSEVIHNVLQNVRTGITTVHSTVDLVRLYEQQPGDYKDQKEEALTRSQQRLNLILTYIEDLLTAGELASGSLPINLEPTLLGDLVMAAIGELRDTALSRNVTVSHNLPDVNLTLRIDHALVRRALQRLLFHSIAATIPGGSVLLTVELNPREFGELLFTIQPRNSGANETPTETLKSAQRVDSLGQADQSGPYMSRLAIQAHGGQLWQATGVETITTFFTLPYSPAFYTDRPLEVDGHWIDPLPETKPPGESGLEAHRAEANDVALLDPQNCLSLIKSIGQTFSPDITLFSKRTVATPR